MHADVLISYPVMEQFYTLQGEGAWAGHAAYFIRLGGCDVGCVWCDVKESWDADAHPMQTVTQLTESALQHPGRLVVITGGEPTLHTLKPLVTALHHAGFRVHIETSGTNPLNAPLDWVTLSPKKFKPALPEALAATHELKAVVYHKSDFQFAEAHAAQVPKDCLLYLQAEWSRREQMTPLIIDYIQQHPQWRLSLQTHKYIGVP